jgi:hypothetical protein
MFSFWNRLWNGLPVAPRGKAPRAGRPPRLEALEDRMMPTWSGGVAFAALAPGAVASPSPTPRVAAAVGSAGSAALISLSVAENSPAAVIDLRAAYAVVAGLQHGDGLKLSILGNTNPGLVRTNLSEAALTLTFARGKSGTATITLCATDADGVSVKRALQVTVRPPSPAVVVYGPKLPVDGLATPPAPSR